MNRQLIRGEAMSAFPQLQIASAAVLPCVYTCDEAVSRVRGDRTAPPHDACRALAAPPPETQR